MKRESPAAILHELKSLREMGSALYIAAHPDDENTELLAYLSRGRNYRTAYMSLTRGDGGQNVLGSDLGAKLGIARTQELLAARRIDGAQQFFSRAVDFGFSKDYRETLNVWNKEEVLSDIVRVIRQFRPDIIITRFSPSPGGTHGHHTASAVLAMEAFKVAADPKAFAEQGLAPWQAKRIMWNTSIFQKDKVGSSELLKIDSGGRDSVSGETFNNIAGASRAMHKTQGFDTFKFPGADNPERSESFALLDGAAMKSDIMEGVDTSWTRLADGNEKTAEVAKKIEAKIDQIIGSFKAVDVGASVPDLLDLRLMLQDLKVTKEDSYILKQKQALLDRILQSCLGLDVQTRITQADVVPGESMDLEHRLLLRNHLSDKIKVQLLSVNYPTVGQEVAHKVDVHYNDAKIWQDRQILPASTPLTQPWWLRAEGTPGMFHTDDARLIGSAENAPAFPIEYNFEIGGQKIRMDDEPVMMLSGSLAAQINKTSRRLDVIQPVALHFLSGPVLFAPGATKTVEVVVTAARARVSGRVQLAAPTGWKVEPAILPFTLQKAGDQEHFKFTLTASSKLETVNVSAAATVNGVLYRNQSEQIDYPHIPTQLLQSPAILKAVCLDLATTGKTVGYLPGAGDSLPENLRQMGFTVKGLDDGHLTLEQLAGVDAVVLGVRAFNLRKNIAAAMPVLLDYIKGGGTVIVQYNRPDKLNAEKLAPFDLHIGPGRVTDEKAAVTFLAPENPILSTPNKIGPSDFEGWVQERGLYFADRWDEHFRPIVACGDAGETPLKGGLLVAQYGKGHYIYTGLAFFRQLPAGVPGAYRLLANMLAVSK
ncbi:MAG: PIG-L family deacetylase [Cyanobacteria bacterium REEB67]|nr:PIG-L family deacetylase [Cyanobacteria bacterium REEB67]